MAVNKMPSHYDLIQYIQHDESTSLHGRGILVNLKPGQYLVRVEANAAKRPGNWFHGPFYNLADARKYAAYLADLGESGIRRVNALPRIWEDGWEGNAVEVIRLYQVLYPSPAISSVVAPQYETGAVMATPEQIEAARTGKFRHVPEYGGQGQQLSMPVKQVSRNHGFDLVKRVVGEETKITKI